MTTDKTPATLAVDVLAVMDRLQSDWRDESQIVGRWDSADDLAAVRAAVAELLVALEPAISEEGMDQPELDRLRAALARVKGESA